MTGKEKAATIIEKIEAGFTVTISNHLRAWHLDLKILNRFRSAGHELIKGKGNSLYLARGRHFDCIDYCKITLWK